MSLMKKLEEAYKRSVPDQDDHDPKDRINRWQGQLAVLFSNIDGWLKEYKDRKLLQVSFSERTIKEENLESYDVPVLHISMPGNKLVVFEPVGTHIIGGYGRIDMYLSGYRNDGYILILRGWGSAAPWEVYTAGKRLVSKEMTKKTLEAVMEKWI